MSVSPELSIVLRELANRERMDLSRLVETLLREHALVRRVVEERRGTPAPSTKRGRSLEELIGLAKVGRRQWERRIEAGQVKLPAEAANDDRKKRVKSRRR